MTAIDDREIAITFLTPERFAAQPQVGVPVVQEWGSLVSRYFTLPSYGETKRDAGAWCPCALEGGRVRGGTGPVSLLVADVDDAGADGLARSAARLAPYAGVIVPTFSATPERQKHRIVLVPSRPMLPGEFPLAWGKMATELAAAGIDLDRGCKNVNRLYFSTVARSAEAWLGAIVLHGAPVDVDAMLRAAAADAEEERAARAARPPPPPVREEHRDRYIAAAIDKARGNVAGAGEGGRHDVLLRETYSLARFGLRESEIVDALLGPFVAAAGEARRREGERAIRDAVAARGNSR